MRKSLYDQMRYWYHISDTLTDKEVRFTPRDSGENYSSSEPLDKRICVAPSIEKCITAIPYTLHSTFTVYRTKSRVKAKRPRCIFDSAVTQEGWLIKPTNFISLGSISFEEIERKHELESVIYESASNEDIPYSREVLRWWKQIKVKRFLKPLDKG